MYKGLSFFSIFLLGINSVIGSGIFLLPKGAFQSFGVYSIFALIFAVVLAILFGLCFAEMSGIYHRDGGAYVYAKETLGDFVGFNVGFLNFFSSTMTWSTSAVAFTGVLSSFFPVFSPDTTWGRFLPSALILLTACITLLGISESTWANNIIAITKIVALLIFCIIGVFFVKSHNLMTKAYIPNTNVLGSFFGAVLILFYAFTGFEMIPLAANTMKNPQKNLPRAIISVLVFVGLFYAVILFVCIGLLGPELATSTSPVAQSFSLVMGNFGFYFIWLVSLISILGILVATSFEAPRSLAPLASDGFLHKVFATESARSVPITSTLTTAVLAALISMTGRFEDLAKALSLVLLILYAIPPITVIISRQRKIKSFFQVPFYPLVPILAILLTFYLIFEVPFSELQYGLGAIITGIIVYFVYAKPMKRKSSYNSTF